ncbi:hypothetical protein, partial [Mycobacterium xenopi]
MHGAISAGRGGLIHLATRGARPAGTELDRPTLRRNGIDAMIGPIVACLRACHPKRVTGVNADCLPVAADNYGPSMFTLPERQANTLIPQALVVRGAVSARQTRFPIPLSIRACG